MTNESRIEISLDPAKIHGHKFTVNGIEYEIKRKAAKKGRPKGKSKANYKQAKIYKIITTKDDMVYVGSTALEYVSTRYATHQYTARKGETTKLYNHMRKVGVENCNIVLIEQYPCENSNQLRRREQHYIDEYRERYGEMCVNSKDAFQNKQRLRLNNAKLRLSNAKYMRNINAWRSSWGSWKGWEACNLLSIDVTLFE